MIKIPAIVVNGANAPSQEFPENAINIVFDGIDYCVYQPGDILPPIPEE